MPGSVKLKIIIGSTALITLVSLVAIIFLFARNNSLEKQLAYTKQVAKKMEADIKALNMDKEEMAKDKEKLQTDATSYMAINTKITQEKEKMQEALDGARKAMDAKEAGLERMKLNLQRLEKEAAAKKGAGGGDKSQAEIKTLKKKIALMDKRSIKDKAVFYYNLGVAYTEAKYYDNAIDAYEKSLKLDDSNAEAHYNLALIYREVTDAQGKAIQHYRAYLKLRPDAPDKEEVEAVINNK